MTLPTLPSKLAVTMPAWAIRAVSLALPLVGTALVWIDPTGQLSTPGIQAAIILAFFIAGFVLFTVHTVLAAVHKYGFSRAALVDVESTELAEAKRVWPEILALWTQAKPTLTQLPGLGAAVDTLTGAVSDVRTKVDAIPATQKGAALAALRALVQDGSVPPVTSATTLPLEPPPSTTEAPAPADAPPGDAPGWTPAGPQSVG